MLTPVKEYFSSDLSDEDIQKAIDIASTEGCLVRLQYVIFHHFYQVNISKDDTLESVNSQLPKTYGL